MDLFKSHQLTDEEEEEEDEECLMEREMVDKDITFHPYPSSSINNSCSISPLSSSSKAFFSSNHHHQEDNHDHENIIHHLPPSHLHHLDLKTIGSSECCVVDEMRLIFNQLFHIIISYFDINLSSHGDSLTTLSHEEELILDEDEDLGSD